MAFILIFLNYLLGLIAQPAAISMSQRFTTYNSTLHHLFTSSGNKNWPSGWLTRKKQQHAPCFHNEKKKNGKKSKIIQTNYQKKHKQDVFAPSTARATKLTSLEKGDLFAFSILWINQNKYTHAQQILFCVRLHWKLSAQVRVSVFNRMSPKNLLFTLF